MTLKGIKELVKYGRVRTFEGKRVYYCNPNDLIRFLSDEDWSKISSWNGICIYPSSTKINKCFYFNWGYGGSPEYLKEITISE